MNNAVSFPDDLPLSENYTPAAPWMKPAPLFSVDLSDGVAPYGVYHGAREWPASGTLRLRNQIVFGIDHLHGFLGLNGALTCQEPSSTRLRLEHFGERLQGPDTPHFVQTVDGGYRFATAHMGRRIQKLSSPVTFASPLEPQNWGAWLTHALPVIQEYVEGGQQGSLLCYADKPWQKSLLGLVGVDPEKLVSQQIGKSYFAGEVAFRAYGLAATLISHADLARIADIKARALSRAGPGAGMPEKIFLSRRSLSAGVYRQLQNENELCLAMETLGFTIIEPERLPFDEQVALMANAKVVAGVGGAAMFNTVFCTPGTLAVTMESTPAFIDHHTNLFASCGLDYGVLLGKPDATQGDYPHHPWTIDVENARRILRDALA